MCLGKFHVEGVQLLLRHGRRNTGSQARDGEDGALLARIQA